MKECARFGIAFMAVVLWLGSGSMAHAQKPIRIGASVAQTGDIAPIGLDQFRGYQLCVKDVNARGGVMGRRLEPVIYDDGSDSTTAARLYERLITQDKVDLVLGPNGSAATEAVAGVIEKHWMPMVAPIAAASSIFTKRSEVRLPGAPSGRGLPGRARRRVDAAAKRGLKTVALITLDDVFTRATIQGASEQPRARGFRSECRR